jgi:hypothetical protein
LLHQNAQLRSENLRLEQQVQSLQLQLTEQQTQFDRQFEQTLATLSGAARRGKSRRGVFSKMGESAKKTFCSVFSPRVEENLKNFSNFL